MKMTKVVIPVFLFGFLGLFIFSCSNGSGGGSGDDSYYAPATPSSNTGNSSNNGDNGEKDEDNDDAEELPTNYIDSPYILKAGTDGSAGTEATYVLFGEWPQTVKAQDVEIKEAIDQDKHLYLGSDGCKYFKMQANPNAHNDGLFSDGSNIVDGTEYYFKVEPIKWIVVTNDYNGTGNALLYSEKILISGIPYDMTIYWLKDNSKNNYIFKRSSSKDKNIYPSNYEYSSVRAVLNGLSYISHYGNTLIDSYKIDSYEIKFKDNGFLQNAFSSEGQNLIATTYVYNGSESMRYYSGTKVADGEESETIDLRCNDTNDKIFLLSKNDLIKFKEKTKYSDDRSSSDLAKASHLYSQKAYFTRTPIIEKVDYYNRYINSEDKKNWYFETYLSSLKEGTAGGTTFSGICPALTIRLD